MREVKAAIALVSLFLIPGSAFAYWFPDYYGQGIGPGRDQNYRELKAEIQETISAVYLVFHG